MDAQVRIAELEAELLAQDERIAEQDARIEALTKQVAELIEKLNQNSKNSHLPPSSDGPGARPGGGSKGSGKKRGGQRGHRGHHRLLVDADQVDKFVELYPPKCESCWKPLPSYGAEHSGAAVMQVRPAALVIERHAAMPSSDTGATRGHAEQAMERLLTTRCCRAACRRAASSSGT